MKAKRFVEVLWEDAEGSASWTSHKDAEKMTPPIVTMRGYIVKRDAKVLILAMGYHEDSWLNVFTIPAKMIKRVTKL